VNHGYARNYLVPNKIATIKRGKQSGSIAPGFGAVFQAQHESVVSALSKQHQQGQQGTLSSEEEDAKQAENIQKAIKKLTSSTLVRSLYCLKVHKK
jgi:ribosomal protein L9